MTGYEAHPIADLFPMLADDELRELAEDIRLRGLLHPVVLDGEGRVLDGRNRIAACELAGIEPTFVTYDGDDPGGYALASNGQRRDMTGRQKAVVAAKVSNLETYGSVRQIARALRVAESSVSEAKVVVRYSDLADAVLARVAPKPFSAALDEARARDRHKVGDERAKQRLYSDAPDLLSLVDEERMTLGEAIAALDERLRVEAIDRKTGRDAAAVLAADLKTAVSSIAIATQLGETGLVTEHMIASCHDAAGLLEKILKEEQA